MKRLLLVILLLLTAAAQAQQQVTVGSKKFTESYVLGEIAKKLLADQGLDVNHRKGIGATSIVWGALRTGEIDVYPEYTGTIGEEILKKPGLSDEQMREQLKSLGIGMSEPLGFNNTYALVMREDQAEQLGIRKIGDLAKHLNLNVKVSHEFLGRSDGWRPLAAKYDLENLQATGVEHGLAYQALKGGQIDVTDAYSTDWQIGDFKLRVLEDDLGYFPQYRAVFLYRLDLPEAVPEALNTAAGKIPEDLMIRMNSEAEKTTDFAAAATLYFQQQGERTAVQEESVLERVGYLTLQHLRMVGLSMVLAILIGIPLGIAASRPGLPSQLILGLVGMIQTIPALALLALLVPIPGLGLGLQTAVLALFLYSLLPIVRNTSAGLQDIPPSVRESAAALGLDATTQLFKIFLPMASRSILAGVKTSTIINIGTATLAALIAQGGLGEPIISGLAINNSEIILRGAIPAAVLALLVGFLFDLLDRFLIPRGLRLRPQSD